ncbi:MAG: asparagine synthase (glutamine-hydrolyzing) [Robiginitomaculum sp.]|nr:MAG: asparagine synthase (glutamine-hydrolyzing) [Robiginitomaculum sp.]
MCGIFAAMTKRPLPEDKARNALETLYHRGPDGNGLWRSQDGCRVLGHTRLSIIGLNNGEQPISSADGGVRLVANGEFYGYQAIRERLRAEGCVFKTDSDSEIALHLYERRGMASADQLRGEFAFVIADERSQTMVAVRDRFGVKPLYYAVVNGDVFFASEIKALLALGIHAAWNIGGACGGLAQPHEQTSFAGIRNLPPGHYAIAKDGDVRIYPYWDWEIPTAKEMRLDDRSEEEVVGAFRDALTDAVRERLVADVEVACYLSGGIDSCAVLGLAQREMSRPIRAFTLSFEEAQYDEGAIAQKQAEFVGSSFTLIPLTGRDIADNYANAVRHAEMPMFNGHGVAKYILSREVQKAGVKVVFTGEGADEMLGGYPPFRLDAITNNVALSSSERTALIDELFSANAATRAFFMPERVESLDVQAVERRLGWTPAFSFAHDAMTRNLLSMMRPEAHAQLALAHPISAGLDRLPVALRMAGRDRLNQALYLCSKTQLPNMILNYLGDRMEMAHSIEGRVPFLDHRVAAAAARTPVNMKVKGSREKHVLREAAKDVLIPEVYDRQKHPFTTPPTRSADDPMMGFYQDVFASKAASEQPIFDMVKVNAALDAYLNCPADQQIASEGGLQQIAGVIVMQEQFNMGTAIGS